MHIRGQVEKLETVIRAGLIAEAREVPCAWHALGELHPSVPADPADIYVGACPECATICSSMPKE